MNNELLKFNRLNYYTVRRYNDSRNTRYSILNTQYSILNTQYALRYKIMQNKPNFQNDKMNVTAFTKKDYDNKPSLRTGKNKANSNPIQSQTKPIDANFERKMLYQYPKQTQFTPLDGGFRLSNGVNPIKQWSQSLRQLLLTEYGCNFGVNNLFLDDNIVWSNQGSRIWTALRFE